MIKIKRIKNEKVYNENELIIFEHPMFGRLKSIMINNEVWFLGKDSISLLGYKDTKKALKTHIEDDQKKQITMKMDIRRKIYIISEGGLYCLILGSKLKQAKKFKRWVTDDVLPSLRKHGHYKLNKQNENYLVIKELAKIEKKESIDYFVYMINLLQTKINKAKEKTFKNMTSMVPRHINGNIKKTNKKIKKLKEMKECYYDELLFKLEMYERNYNGKLEFEFVKDINYNYEIKSLETSLNEHKINDQQEQVTLIKLK